MIIPDKLAQQWVSAWNNRDLELLIDLYAENTTVHSPFAKLITSNGVIRGKENLRAYRAEIIRRMPNYRLELIAVYSGHLAIAIQCKDDKGRDLVESMLFDAHDKIIYETACLRR